jgi:hypothetical protein
VQSLVHMRCEPRGDHLPPLPRSTPRVRHRVGIDLAPIDVTDTSATRWLRALVWPEHTERAQRLEAALDQARRSPPQLISGDLADVLPAAGRCAARCHSLYLPQLHAEPLLR